MRKSVSTAGELPLIEGPKIARSSKGSSGHKGAFEEAVLDVSDIVQEMDSFRNLRYGWDGDQAHGIASDAIEAAKRFIHTAIDFIVKDFRSWHSPTPCADPDGGVELYWEETNRWLELLFLPDDHDRILAVRGQGASNPIKQEASFDEALLLVRWVLDSE